MSEHTTDTQTDSYWRGNENEMSPSSSPTEPASVATVWPMRLIVAALTVVIVTGCGDEPSEKPVMTVKAIAVHLGCDDDLKVDNHPGANGVVGIGRCTAKADGWKTEITIYEDNDWRDKGMRVSGVRGVYVDKGDRWAAYQFPPKRDDAAPDAPGPERPVETTAPVAQ